MRQSATVRVAQGGAARIALGLAASVLACLMLSTTAAAQAPQNLYDWPGATPPSWFTESTDSSCYTRELYDETIGGDFRRWSISWARNSQGNSCFKPFPPPVEFGEEDGIYCRGSASYGQRDDGPDMYTAVWDCQVGESSYGCQRRSQYEESPLGDPNESFNYDSGGWHETDDVTGGPTPCDPKDSMFEDEPATDSSACDRAKQKVKKAKKKVRKADTPFEKTKAKNKLKKAKRKKKDACVTPARVVTD